MSWSLHREFYIIPRGCTVERGLWAVTLAGYLKTDSLQQLLPFCLQCISCRSEMQHQSTCCLCLTRLFCISFCFVSSFTTEQQKRLSSLAGMM